MVIWGVLATRTGPLAAITVSGVPRLATPLLLPRRIRWSTGRQPCGPWEPAVAAVTASRPCRAEPGASCTVGWGAVDDGSMEGRAYLEKYVADRLPADHGQPPEGGGLTLDRSEVRGVAIGLVAAGALAQEEMERILAGLDEELERRGRLTRVETRMSAEGRVSPVHWAPLSVEARQQLVLQQGRERAQWREPAVDPAQLREVIPLAGRRAMLDAVPATLISLECWSTMVVARLAYAGTDAHHPGLPDSRQSRLKRWRGWDDAGTQYRSHSGSVERRGGLFMESVVFEPGAPDEARTLTLAFDHDGGSERVTVGIGGRTAPA
ncbi:hypothetical protein ACQPWW_19030 [Micromonospora sp. CA-240977]|uniref:hypothetical protein n=1 Tax=Micromonospora sp. CA-240977 TaxID=3239957 RepID=UPI003D8C27E3